MVHLLGFDDEDSEHPILEPLPPRTTRPSPRGEDISVRGIQQVDTTDSTSPSDGCCDEMGLRVAEKAVGPVTVHVVYCSTCEHVRETVVVEP